MKIQVKKGCNHSLQLICHNCTATWSDPRRAVSALLEYMKKYPALKHNIAEIREDLLVKEKMELVEDLESRLPSRQDPMSREEILDCITDVLSALKSEEKEEVGG